MYKKISHAMGLLMVFLFSTFSVAFSPPATEFTKNRQNEISATGAKTIVYNSSVTKNYGSDFINPYRHYDPNLVATFTRLKNDPKPDNTIINGILNELKQERYQYLILKT